MKDYLLRKAIGLAQLEAQKSTMAHHKIGAVIIDKKGNVIVKAYNEYVDRSIFKNDKYSFHAEEMCLNKLKFKQSMNKHYVILIRVNNDGNIIPCIPCGECEKILINAGFQKKNIYCYTKGHRMENNNLGLRDHNLIGI